MSRSVEDNESFLKRLQVELASSIELLDKLAFHKRLNETSEFKDVEKSLTKVLQDVEDELVSSMHVQLEDSEIEKLLDKAIMSKAPHLSRRL